MYPGFRIIQPGKDLCNNTEVPPKPVNSKKYHQPSAGNK